VLSDGLFVPFALFLSFIGVVWGGTRGFGVKVIFDFGVFRSCAY